MKRINKRKLFMGGALLLMISMNLVYACRDYNLSKVSLTRFFARQALHQYTASGKITTIQIFRESFAADTMIEQNKSETDGQLLNIIHIRHDIRYQP